MRSRKHFRSRGRPFADEYGNEGQTSRPPLRGDRKARQLCRQVADTLGQVLSGECDDEILRSLQVVTVAPAPDASQLLVIVAPALAEDRLDPAEVVQRLAIHSGRLRCEVAASITRKRAPRLAFQFISGPPDPS